MELRPNEGSSTCLPHQPTPPSPSPRQVYGFRPPYHGKRKEDGAVRGPVFPRNSLGQEAEVGKNRNIYSFAFFLPARGFHRPSRTREKMRTAQGD